MKILIGADLAPTKTNIDLFAKGNIKKIIGEDLLKELENSDMRIFNLETPLIMKENPIKKIGVNLGIDAKVINGIKKMNPTFITLANNHIMDHGVSGLVSTIETLEKSNIDFGGIANNLSEVNKMYIKEINNKKIGIYCCSEHEFSIVSDNKPGAIPFDYIDSFNCIEENKDKCDFIIVLYHGGKEYYPYPSPRLQKVCRNFIDKGADFVVCQHSHCIGSEETYHNKKIVYGQGNFLFDRGDREERKHGLLLELNIMDNEYDLNYIVLSKAGNCIKKADYEEYNDIIDSYKNRSKEITSDNFVRENYKKFAEDNISSVLNRVDILPNTFIAKVLNKLSNKRILKFYLKKVYMKKMSYKLANTIECEAWNELLQEILDSYNK